jgi:hypothetical protein
MASPSPTAADRSESARYALLRRLAPSMRHHLVVNLQPIGMIYEVLDRRLRAPEPDLAHVHASAQKINGFARAALHSCLDVVTWLAPEDGAVTTAGEGVHECVSLLATGLSFRGFRVHNEVGTVAGEVGRSAVRNVLTAALIQATDEVAPPAELVLRARPTAVGLELTLRLRACDGEQGSDVSATYRQLARTDVQALAAAEGVEMSGTAQDCLVLTFPWVRPARA